MMDRLSLKEWQKQFNEGAFDANNFSTQCKAGWHDWFCRDTSLAGKTKRMGRIVKQIKEGGKVNLDTMYVWFKNKRPCVGPLYDDFRIADLETRTTLLTIKIDDKREDHRYCVWGRKNTNRDNEFENNFLFETDSSRELVKWLNTAW